jgi:hypothetical protein
MFVHTVFFWLKDTLTADEKATFRKHLHALTNITHMQTAHVGVAAPTNRPVIDNSYDYSLTFIFKSIVEHDHYQVDPIHKEFVEKCQHMWTRVQVYDTVPA